MDNYGPVDAPRIEGVPLLLSTEEAREADSNFEWVVSHISSRGIAACMTETRAEYFPELVPNRFHTSPMWILWLPDEFSDEIHLHEGFSRGMGR